MLRGLRGVKFVQRQFIACRWKQTEADGPFNEDYLKPQVGKPFSEVPQTDNLKFLRDTQLEVNKASKERPEMDLFFGKMIDNYGNVIRVDQPEIANIFTSNPDDFAITFRAKGTDGTQTAKGTQFVRAYKQKRNIPPGLFDADDINEVQAALATIYEHPALLSKETTDMFKVYSDRIIEIVKKHLDPYTKTTNNLNEM